MNTFLVHVGDERFCRVLPSGLDPLRGDHARVRVMGLPPLGIQTLAPILRQRRHRVRMFDTCHPRMAARDIAQAAAGESPDVVALSFLSVTAYAAVKAMARALKAAAPWIRIIVGGPFATGNARRILGDCADIDCVGVGEGEELLPDYLEHLAEPGAVAGLVWRRDGRVVENTARPLIEDLDVYPFPDRVSLPIDYLHSLPPDLPAVLSEDRFCTVQTSRRSPSLRDDGGAPSPGPERRRSRSPARVLAELQDLHQQGYRSVYLTDDPFLFDRARTEEICRGMIERGIGIRWGCEGRVDAVGMGPLPVMREAGCAFLAFGVVSGTQKVLDRLGRPQTLEQVETAVREARRQGIGRVHGAFVVGAPGEDEADVLESFRFAARLELDTFGFSLLCVQRGALLWDEYVARGILDDDRDWDKGFTCADVDPTTLRHGRVEQLRAQGLARLFRHRLLRHPIPTLGLLRVLGRHRKAGEWFRVLAGPFRRRPPTPKPVLPARMVDAGLDEPLRGAGPRAGGGGA